MALITVLYGMSLRSHFKDLFRYTEWANERILVAIEENKIDDDKVMSLYSHIISVQMIWLLRIEGLPTSPFPVWEKYKLSELKTMTEESHRNWLEYLEAHKMETFEEMISYSNPSGKKFENTIRQIINQVINHGSYHRGQIAIKLREMEIDPPATDYIFYRSLV